MPIAATIAKLPRSRFAAAPAWLAGLVLAFLAVAIVFGLTPPARSGSQSARVTAVPATLDVDLYKAIAARVAAGQSYYAAAATEQRAQDYPLRPFVTMRLPTLALIHATAGPIGAAALLWGLLLLLWIKLDARLRADLDLPPFSLITCIPVALALTPFLSLQSLYLHEPWAATLVALSLLSRRRERWGVSVMLALAAVMIRELALPYVCVMAVVAAWDGTRREVAAWLAVILAFALALAGHAYLVSTVVTAADPASPGWTGLGGWRFLLTMANNFTGFVMFPLPTVAVLLPLALVGLAGWRSAMGLRAALLVGGYSCAFMVIGRPDNDYWALMIAPILPLGLVFATGALRDLWEAVRVGLARRDRAPA